jgi:ABC-2 type transport system ATP-binding protein
VRTLFSRKYEAVRAVDNISFEIARASKVAFIGANGAGKSTTIKMLTGIMTPTSGRCVVAGIEPYRERQRNARNIGVVFGQRSQLWWDLSVPDAFQILRRIYEIPDAVFQRNLAVFRELLDIDALGVNPVRKLSLGQRMRAEVAASLLHDPAVLFWDEPTVGLDLNLKEAVRELVNRIHRERDATVFLTSHDLGDIAAICDDALVVDHGRVIHQGTIQALLGRATTRSVLFEHRGPQSPAITMQEIERLLPETSASVNEGRRFKVEYPVERYSAREVLALMLEKFDIVDCFVPEPDLQNVLRELYRSGQDAGATVPAAA